MTPCSMRSIAAPVPATALRSSKVFGPVTADDEGPGKPAPDGYRAAAAKLGRPAGGCIVVEDSPVGIQAGRAAGMRVIGVATTFDARTLDADWVVNDLSSVRCAIASTR